MADVKWIKITTDIFDDEKILLIESLPMADSIITVWFKLLVLAGKQNNSGVFTMNDKIPYTDEMLATIFRRDIKTIRVALSTFEKFDMIEVVDGVITIPNWNKHQTLDAYEKKKERDRIYQQNRRAEQRLIAEKSSDTSADYSSDVAVSDKEVDKEVDKDYIITDSKESVCRTEVQRVVDTWNSLEDIGIKGISKMSSTSKRYRSLVARIKEYGTDKVIEAIESIRNSDFLRGKNKNGWAITFDWFILPNNFPKVLDGNYLNADGPKQRTGDARLDRLYNRVNEVDNW